jgi:hypothetical protein
VTLSVLHVIWRDSEASIDWTPVSEVSEELDVTHTVGLLIKETESFLLIALSYDPATESIINTKKIPRSAIEKVRKLCSIKMTKS